MNAREAALNTLTAITRDGAYTSLALKNHLPSSMPDDDRRFASLLVRTTLENLLRIDYALEGFIKSKRVHGIIRNILRLGACQLLFLETQGYAAVNESVALAKKRKPPTAGFVNAVLRALVKEKDAITYPKGNDAQSLSVNLSYPLWICEKYIADFGFDFTKKLLSAKAPLTTHVRCNTLKIDTHGFEKALNETGLEYQSGSLDGAYAVSGLTDMENLTLYKKGLMAVQSESAMRAVLAIGISKGDKILDCCAAPGGKSAYAAALTDGQIDITAWDIRQHRVDMMRKNFDRLGVNASTEIMDASIQKAPLLGSYDVVLLDAPCSAMGLMAHSPDIRYVRKPHDIKELSVLQSSILSACSGYVKTGGIFAYMTCSINKEENEDVVSAFLESNKDFVLSEPSVTLYPHLCNSDGFFYAIMRKR